MISIRYNQHLWKKSRCMKQWNCKYAEWTTLSIYKSRYTNLFNVKLIIDDKLIILSEHKKLKTALSFTRNFMSIKQDIIINCESKGEIKCH